MNLRMRTGDEVLWLVFKLALGGLCLALLGVYFGPDVPQEYQRYVGPIAGLSMMMAHALPAHPRWLSLVCLAISTLCTGMASAPIIHMLADMLSDAALLGIVLTCLALPVACNRLAKGRRLHWMVPHLLFGIHLLWGLYMVKNKISPLTSLPWGLMGIVVCMAYFVEDFCYIHGWRHKKPRKSKDLLEIAVTELFADVPNFNKMTDKEKKAELDKLTEEEKVAALTKLEKPILESCESAQEELKKKTDKEKKAELARLIAEDQKSGKDDLETRVKRKIKVELYRRATIKDSRWGDETVEQRHGWNNTLDLAYGMVKHFLELFQAALILALIILLKFYQKVTGKARLQRL